LPSLDLLQEFSFVHFFDQMKKSFKIESSSEEEVKHIPKPSTRRKSRRNQPPVVEEPILLLSSDDAAKIEVSPVKAPSPVKEPSPENPITNKREASISQEDSSSEEDFSFTKKKAKKRPKTSTSTGAPIADLFSVKHNMKKAVIIPLEKIVRVKPAFVEPKQRKVKSRINLDSDDDDKDQFQSSGDEIVILENTSNIIRKPERKLSSSPEPEAVRVPQFNKQCYLLDSNL
jgi:hypothetical protein